MYKKYSRQINIIEREFLNRTPVLVYSESILADKCVAISQPIVEHAQGKLYYPLKANYDPTLLRVMARNGIDGMEVMSPMELSHVRSLFGRRLPIIYSGISPSIQALRDLDPDQDLLVINSLADAIALKQHCVHRPRIKVLLRISFPKIDSTIGYNSTTGKLGIIAYSPEMFQVLDVLANCDTVELSGIHSHQLIHQKTSTRYLQLMDELARLCVTVEQLTNFQLETIDIGGGLESLDTARTATIVTEIASAFTQKLPSRNLIFEPGRAITNSCGIIATRVLSTRSRKLQHFCFVDAGTNLLVPTTSKRHMVIQDESAFVGRPINVTFADRILSPVNTIVDNVRMDHLPKPGDFVLFGNCGAYTTSLEHQWCQPLHQVYLLDLWERIHPLVSEENTTLAWENRYGVPR